MLKDIRYCFNTSNESQFPGIQIDLDHALMSLVISCLDTPDDVNLIDSSFYVGVASVGYLLSHQVHGRECVLLPDMSVSNKLYIYRYCRRYFCGCL